MYCVGKGVAWDIRTRYSGVVVLEVTSEGYAKFLCNKLSSGHTVSDISNRDFPDLEYFSNQRVKDLED